jgi:ABC-type amino acid transport system permease subunit
LVVVLERLRVLVSRSLLRFVLSLIIVVAVAVALYRRRRRRQHKAGLAVQLSWDSSTFFVATPKVSSL